MSASARRTDHAFAPPAPPLCCAAFALACRSLYVWNPIEMEASTASKAPRITHEPGTIHEPNQRALYPASATRKNPCPQAFKTRLIVVVEVIPFVRAGRVGVARAEASVPPEVRHLELKTLFVS